MITRIKSNQRMSQAVKYNGTVYLAGQVGTAGDSVANQTQQCLQKVENLLTEAGSSKSQILQTIIWLDSMTDFDEMNQVWDDWMTQENAPARATGEARLANPELKVEIIVIAAYSND